MDSVTSSFGLVKQSLLPEINTNGGYEPGVEGAIGVLVQEAGLAHARIAQSKELDQVVVVPSVIHQNSWQGVD